MPRLTCVFLQQNHPTMRLYPPLSDPAIGPTCFTQPPSSLQNSHPFGHEIHSIPIEHGPAPSKSSYRKCSGDLRTATPEHFSAGALPIKPKDLDEAASGRATQ